MSVSTESMDGLKLAGRHGSNALCIFRAHPKRAATASSGGGSGGGGESLLVWDESKQRAHFPVSYYTPPFLGSLLPVPVPPKLESIGLGPFTAIHAVPDPLTNNDYYVSTTFEIHRWSPAQFATSTLLAGTKPADFVDSGRSEDGSGRAARFHGLNGLAYHASTPPLLIEKKEQRAVRRGWCSIAQTRICCTSPSVVLCGRGMSAPKNRVCCMIRIRLHVAGRELISRRRAFWCCHVPIDIEYLRLIHAQSIHARPRFVGVFAVGGVGTGRHHSAHLHGRIV